MRGSILPAIFPSNVSGSPKDNAQYHTIFTCVPQPRTWTVDNIPATKPLLLLYPSVGRHFATNFLRCTLSQGRGQLVRLTQPGAEPWTAWLYIERRNRKFLRVRLVQQRLWNTCLRYA